MRRSRRYSAGETNSQNCQSTKGDAKKIPASRATFM